MKCEGSTGKLRWLVIGYGSSIHKDDRFGLCVSEALRGCIEDESVQVISAHQLSPELSEPLSRADGAVFIDASVDLQPGELQCLLLNRQGCGKSEPKQAPVASAAFTHHLTPVELLEGAAMLFGHSPPAWLYTVGGGDFGIGEELSQSLTDMVPEVVSLVLERISGGRETEEAVANAEH